MNYDINKKIFFSHDYSAGAHPKIIEALYQSNLIQTRGYGDDVYCQKAKNLIREKCNNQNLGIYFLVGGTQTNLIFLSSVLRNYQGIIAPETGHIATHESGAIEARGHKVLTLKSNKEGKITSKQIEELYLEHANSDINIHTVQPGGVYISHPTENGALYSKQELIEISNVCKKSGLFLYLDGARLGYALASEKNELTLPILSEYTDSFYIGGTKCGSLVGEALVIKNKNYSKDFEYSIKQGGGLLAKGRLLGIQFKELFTDNLYVNICLEANKFAKQIADSCLECGYSLYSDSFTNQQFIIFPNKVVEKLEEKYVFALWGKIDNENSVIRICTAWDTTEEMVNNLISDIKKTV